MKQAMIFAAGLGTRLKPITDTMPKALVPVGGEPLLQRVLMKLKDAGFERVVINVHHFAEQIVCFLRAKDMFGMDIHISYERDMLLETGGGIKKASSLFDASSPFLIHNVDILSNVDLADFYERAHDCDALLLVSERKTKRYLLFNDEMNLVGWTNIETGEVKSPFENIKTMSLDALKSQYKLYAFSGIHVFSPSLFPLMEPYPDRFGIIDFYLNVCNRSRIKGWVKDDLQLMDVGKIDTLQEAEKFIKNNI
ncbi:MAG: nucleotidyltransferase family protein [Prevotella sp.]|nr:nucleotidyltransferase family protein [Prevotella sp.]